MVLGVVFFAASPAEWNAASARPHSAFAAAASLGSGESAKNEGGGTTRATGERPSARRFVGDPAARAGLDGRKDTYTGNASRKPSRGGGGRGKR